MTIALIANPCAGRQKGARTRSRVESLLRDHGIDYRLFVTRYHGHGMTISQKLSPQRFEGIVSMGGDGTNFHVLNGLLKTHDPSVLPPLGIIPTGSGNSFARDLGIFSAGDAIQKLAEHQTRPVDVCGFSQKGEKWYFVNLVGLGFVTDVTKTASRLKGFGDLGYVLGVFFRLLELKFHHIELAIDGRRLDAKNCFVAFCNSRYTGGKMLMAPDAKIDDGWFDVVVAGPISRLSLLSTFPKIFTGTHLQHPAVRVYQARKAVIRTKPPKTLLPDGELCGSTPTEITIHPRRIRYFA